MTTNAPRAELEILGRRARELEGPRVIRAFEFGELERDRERPARRAEERLGELGIQPGELFVGRLLGQIDVRPESLDGTIIRHVDMRRRVVVAVIHRSKSSKT